MNLIQNLKNNSRKGDFIIFAAFLLIVASMILFAYHIFDSKLNECTSDPIKFGVNKIKENYEVEKVYGTLTLSTNNEIVAQWSFGDELELYQSVIDTSL